FEAAGFAKMKIGDDRGDLARPLLERLQGRLRVFHHPRLQSRNGFERDEESLRAALAIFDDENDSCHGPPSGHKPVTDLVQRDEITGTVRVLLQLLAE